MKLHSVMFNHCTTQIVSETGPTGNLAEALTRNRRVEVLEEANQLLQGAAALQTLQLL